ncbi:MAG TPA: AAA domain-containing protein, partial [Streptosporangiaceae bacterium]|nr:AAA domain-containing protein [Streptosporangiaceae bacterium]
SLHRRLVDKQRRLTQHVTSLHEVHAPWGVSRFQVQAALLGIPAEARTPVRLSGVSQISGAVAEQLRDELREYAHLGGFTHARETTPWYGAAIGTAEQAREAVTVLARLATESYPPARQRVGRANTQAGLRPLTGYAEWGERLALFSGVLATWQRLAPEVYRSEPERLAAATAPRAERSAMPWLERRKLLQRARSLWVQGRPTPEVLHRALTDAASQLATWKRLRVDGGWPRVPDGLAEAVNLHAECERDLAALRGFVAIPDDPEDTLQALVADSDTPWQLPRLYQLRARFAQLGLETLLGALAGGDVTPQLAVAAFDHAWYASVLDEIRVREGGGTVSGAALDEVAEDFRRHDVEHLRANCARVRREAARRLRDAQDQHPLQARVLRKQAALRRRHMPLRRLIDQASDVLFAAKPCWAMSPLVVSQVLPPATLFDVVIFDEASQITPADAIPSIMRAHQVVVAGDDRQLPPTSFFRQVGGDDPEAADEDGADEASVVSFGSGFESILDTLRPLLPTAPLTWHYRSRDERLVAFSNTRIYDGALTTFPGVIRDDCLRHVVVPHDGATGQETSVTNEVRAVVDLVLEHARTRPTESLGVIALGIKHAERIDELLRTALGGNAGVEEFFAEDRAEPFFVKNLERVQGDERDAIILSIGYGKHPDGRMRYHWGPLLRLGGERRLNVATTRARHRLTLVSSFASHDIDPDRLTSAGARLLSDYLAYAATGGTTTGGPASANGKLGPFEADVQRRLAESGISVVPRFGVGGYRVDFAAVHPGMPGRMVLAIEADGPSYAASRSARDRDRLRKEHLERLGWSFHRIWSGDWFRDPESEVEKIQAAYEGSVAGVPEEPPAAPPPGPATAAPADTNMPGQVTPGHDIVLRAPSLPDQRPTPD